MLIKISFPNGVKDGEVALTPSKSISNRILIIETLANKKFEIENLSTSTDTQSLVSALKFENSVIDVSEAGTTFRFLVSLLATKPGIWLLTGSNRMKTRPIGILVECLKSLGANIEFQEKEDFPPVLITGQKLMSKEIEIDANISSQFISSLMMIAPTIEGGLQLILKNKISSLPYLNMTASIMKSAGITVKFEKNRISIPQGEYNLSKFKIENDWSGASYWYLLCALNPGSKFVLNDLSEISIQGDSILSELMVQFGVKTVFNSDNAIINSEHCLLTEFNYDFTNCPDLVMTFAVLCIGKGIKAEFSGVQNLRIKESDRLNSLKIELEKCGALVELNNDKIIINPIELKNPERIEVYNDHRIAMSFAPLASLIGPFEIENPSVVNKSYPEFWKQMEGVGAFIGNL